MCIYYAVLKGGYYMASKLEEILRTCAEIEVAISDHNLSKADGKFLTLCGFLAKGTKYQKEVDRIAELYLKEYTTDYYRDDD
jgi:hypothetical protein